MPQCVNTGEPYFLSLDELQAKADRYFNYISSKVPTGQNVYLSNVISKEDLLAILSDEHYGVRVILVKEDNPDQGKDDTGTAEQAKIGMLVVPVIKEGEEPNEKFINQLGETDKVIYEECPSKYCQSATSGLSLP